MLLSPLDTPLSCIVTPCHPHRLIPPGLCHQGHTVALGDEGFHGVRHGGRGLDVEDQGREDILLKFASAYRRGRSMTSLNDKANDKANDKSK